MSLPNDGHGHKGCSRQTRGRFAALHGAGTIFPYRPMQDSRLRLISWESADSHLALVSSRAIQGGEPGLPALEAMQEMVRVAGGGIPVQVRAPPAIKWAGEIAKST